MNFVPKESLRTFSIPVISCSNQEISPSIRISNASAIPSTETSISVVEEIDPDSSRVGLADGRKEIEYSIASLPGTNILEQGKYQINICLC